MQWHNKRQSQAKRQRREKGFHRSSVSIEVIDCGRVQNTDVRVFEYQSSESANTGTDDAAQNDIALGILTQGMYAIQDASSVNG
jgi:hypothetical protein